MLAFPTVSKGETNYGYQAELALGGRVLQRPDREDQVLYNCVTNMWRNSVDACLN